MIEIPIGLSVVTCVTAFIYTRRHSSYRKNCQTPQHYINMVNTLKIDNIQNRLNEGNIGDIKYLIEYLIKLIGGIKGLKLPKEGVLSSLDSTFSMRVQRPIVLYLLTEMGYVYDPTCLSKLSFELHSSGLNLTPSGTTLLKVEDNNKDRIQHSLMLLNKDSAVTYHDIYSINRFLEHLYEYYNLWEALKVQNNQDVM